MAQLCSVDSVWLIFVCTKYSECPTEVDPVNDPAQRENKSMTNNLLEKSTLTWLSKF